MSKTIVIVIIGHGYIPIEKPEPEPEPNIFKLPSSEPVPESLTYKMSDLRKLHKLKNPENPDNPDKQLNIVKYSYTAAGVCSVGAISLDFYNQFNYISREFRNYVDAEPLLAKMQTMKEELYEYKKSQGIPTLEGYLATDKYRVTSGYDPRGSHIRDMHHSIGRDGSIAQLSDNVKFVDKQYILRRNEDDNPQYKLGIFCAYSDGIVKSPHQTDVDLSKILDVKEMAKFTLFREEDGEDVDWSLSSIIEVLIDLGYDNIGIYDFTCSNYKMPDGTYLGYDTERRSDAIRRDLRSRMRADHGKGKRRKTKKNIDKRNRKKHKKLNEKLNKRSNKRSNKKSIAFTS